MSITAVLYFKSGRFHDGSAPSSVDPEGRFLFCRNFPKMVDILDESARTLGVTQPSQFIWDNPLYSEGELDKLSEAEIQELKRRYDAMAKWIPIGQGIETFGALTLRHELSPEEGKPSEREYYIAFEVACFHAALREAAISGEQAFHIQCY